MLHIAPGANPRELTAKLAVTKLCKVAGWIDSISLAGDRFPASGVNYRKGGPPPRLFNEFSIPLRES